MNLVFHKLWISTIVHSHKEGILSFEGSGVLYLQYSMLFREYGC